MLDSLISGATKLIGGVLGDKATEKQNQQNIQLQRELADRNEALQREFATSGIQWKVADAQKAGVHPLYALGASTTSFSPISMGGGVAAKDSLASNLSDMGQDVSRAIRATSSHEDRAYDQKMKLLNLEKAGLENQLLRDKISSEVTRNNSAQVGPPMPTGPSFPVVEDDPDKGKPAMLMGKRIFWPKTTSPQQTFEDNLGDSADWTMAPFIYADVLRENFFRRAQDYPNSWSRKIHKFFRPGRYKDRASSGW